jgi:hypothetical protein
VATTRRPIYVFEHSDRPPRRLFRLLGVEWLGTPLWWVSPLWMLAVGLGVGQVIGPGKDTREKLATGLGYSLLVGATVSCHALGHIVSGKLAGAPMWANVLTASLPVNQYRDDRTYPSRVHVMRALGGGFANFLVALVSLSLNLAVGGHHFLRFAATSNIAMGLAAWTPIPSLDGSVVVRELRHWQPSRD